MGRALLTIFWVIVAALGGCTNIPPQAELEAYRVASAGMLDATRGLADTLAPVERRAGPKTGDPDQPAHLLPFTPEDAAYFATIGDPPLAAHVKKAAETLAGFNAAMILYAEGRSWERIAPQLDAVAGSADSVIGLLPVAGEARAVLAAGKPVFVALARAVRRAEDRDSFRRMVIEDAPKVEAVIRHLRSDVSPLVHTMLQTGANRDLLAVARSTPGADPDALAAAAAARKGALRTVVANWVVMLDHTLVVLDRLGAAVKRGGGDAAGVAFAATEAAAAATHVRASIIALNALPTGGR